MKTESPRSFLNSPCSRKKFRIGWWSGCLLIVVYLAALAGHASAQTPSYGPQNILTPDGILTPYNYTGTDPITGNPCDFYTYGGLLVEQDGSLRDTNGNSYGNSFDYVNSSGWNGYFAIAADGVTILGTPAGLTFRGPSSVQFWNNSGATFSRYFSTPSNNSGYSIPVFDYDASHYEVKYFSSATYFQLEGSPWYWYDGTDVVFDMTNMGMGFPPSTVVPPPPPTAIYLNGALYTQSSVSYMVGGGSYSQFVFYSGPGPNGDITIEENSSSGTPQQSYIWGNSDHTGEPFSTTFDPSTGAIGSGVPSDIAISVSLMPNGTPAHGPAMVSWNSYLLSFYYTTTDGKDLYWNPGDADGDYTVIVSADNSVAAVHGNIDATGAYDPTNGMSGVTDLIAQDANGNPIGLMTGMTLLFGSSGSGHQMLREDGTVQYNPQFTYRRPDGSWGLKYGIAGNDLAPGVYLVQDDNGNYTSPPYKFLAAEGDTMVNALTGWPATNIYPQQLYINGIPCTQVAGSQYDSGAGFPRNGGASYRAAAYDLTVVLSWNWDTSTGFQGFITGKYGQSSSFRGSWDGLGNFANLTNGAIASVTAPTSIPTDGNPPRISVNGSALAYNSLASTALANAGTPGDVYTGALGQTLTIYQDGATSFTPGTGGTPVTGTYNPTTYQFSFGTSGNSVTVTHPDGSTSMAVITATDTAGHNLAPSIGGATNSNGATELAGGLDVRGNTFTLGSWTNGSESLFGFGLAYGDATIGSGNVAQLNLSTSRAAVNWSWIHPSTDGGSDQITAMQLDYAHRVILYDPANPANANIVLDPSSNGSVIRSPLRIQPQGDIPMGSYQSSPVIP